MFRLIKTDTKVLMHKKGFQIAFVIMLIYALLVTLVYAHIQKGSDVSMLYHPAILSGLNSDMEYVWFFCRWFPFLIVLPAGFSIVNDRNTNMKVFFECRRGKKEYYISKLVSSFIVTFITMVVPFLVQLGLNVIIFSGGATRSMTNWPTYSSVYFEQSEAYLLTDLFNENVYIYFICSLILTGIFSGCLAVFLVGISTLGFKYKAFLFLPIYLVIYVVTYLGNYIEGLNTNIDFYITLYDAVNGKSLIFYSVFMIVLVLIGVGCSVYSIKNKENVS